MGVEAEGRRALRVIVVLILNEVLLGMVILVHPCLSGIEVRGRNPLDSAVCAFPRCPAACSTRRLSGPQARVSLLIPWCVVTLTRRCRAYDPHVGKPRRLAVWCAVVVVVVVAALWLTGTLSDVYCWLVRYMHPEVWSALGTWVTAAIAAVAGLYAKRQVDEARITRERQAQPNVVAFAENNAKTWYYLDLVFKTSGRLRPTTSS